MNQTASIETRLPPGPALNSEQAIEYFNASPFEYLESLQRQFGTLFTLPLGKLGNDNVPIRTNGAWVFLTRPHQIKAMYDASYDEASGALANKVFFGTNEASVAYIDGKSHRCRRSQLLPMFNGTKDYTQLIMTVLDRSISRWPKDRPFALFRELQKVTSEIITEVTCGSMDNEAVEELRTMLVKTEDARYTRQQLVDADQAIRAFIEQQFEHYFERAKKAGKGDVLSTLLQLSADGDGSLSTEVIRDEVFSLLYTGFSTTANTLAWAFIHILNDQRVYQCLLSELKEKIGARRFDLRDLNELKYLDATIRETLRLHPVTPLNGVRMLNRPLRLDEYIIPAGTVLVHCAYLLQRSPEVYENPQNFVPERFLDKKIDPYEWGAFGGGSRMCLGRGFSLAEMKAILTRVLTTTHLERQDGIPKAKQQGFFLAPEDDAKVNFSTA